MATVIVVVAVLLVLAVAVAAFVTVRARRRRAALQAGFGREYERTVAGSDNRRDAERELLARQQEHEQLELRPLSEASCLRYREEWSLVQAKFVDAPVLALSEADSLVSRLLADRGYPTDGFDDQARLLSVEHAQVIEDYRQAHAVESESRSGTAETEAVRSALLDFRRVFEDVIETADGSTASQPIAR
jgi:hypothetical protein